jgi:hypothetical protein
MTAAVLPGLGGSLFPGRYLLDALSADAAPQDGARIERRRRQLAAWWQAAALSCGPATGLRALFDVVARPLAGALGFRARDVSFERALARVRLESPGATPVGLVILPWAAHRSSAWRDVTATARAMGAR